MTLSTIFPPIPRTVWRPGDPEITCLLGDMRDGLLYTGDNAGLAMRGPRIPLDVGLYGVEFQMGIEGDDLPAELEIARAQVTAGSGSLLLAEQAITAGDLAGEFGGMYQGMRLDVIVEGRLEDVEFRVVASGAAWLRIRGIKLVPRPGLIWFPSQINLDPQHWAVAAERSANAIGTQVMRTPGVMLAPGDYRVGIKLKPPAGMTTGAIAAIQVSGIRDTETGWQVIASDDAVTAEDMLANHGVPDAKLRFRLAKGCAAALQVKALAPGLTVQWLRLATADEATWHHYFNLGGNRSELGGPTSGFVTAESAASGGQGAYRRFEHGLIVWTIEDGPCEVMGEIGRRYEAQGGIDGASGFPTGRPKLGSGGEISQRFEGGVLNTNG